MAPRDKELTVTFHGNPSNRFWDISIGTGISSGGPEWKSFRHLFYTVANIINFSHISYLLSFSLYSLCSVSLLYPFQEALIHWFLPLFLPWWCWAPLCWHNQPRTSSRSAGCRGWCTAGCPGTAERCWIRSGYSRSGEPSPQASRSDSDYFSSGKGGGQKGWRSR